MGEAPEGHTHQGHQGGLDLRGTRRTKPDRKLLRDPARKYMIQGMRRGLGEKENKGLHFHFLEALAG